MSEMRWQPIETAPQGKLVLLYHPAMLGRHGQVSNVEWINVDIYPPPYPRKPTMWCPIPEMPR